MKGPVIAALHALIALKRSNTPTPEIVLQAVPSEEDGGLGTFAALQQDDRFDAALLPEPTALRVVCAQAGALTFKGVVKGKAAHAAERLAGVSAIDRYVPLHQALHEHERNVNANVAHPLMRELELPYPLLVGRLNAGEWSSMVPDRLEFEGRLGVPVGADLQQARDELQRVVENAAPSTTLTWEGGAFAPGETDPEHPWARKVRAALSQELGREAPVAGVPWGADMRLFTARGIPAVMVGTTDIELAHAVDESVSIDQLVTVARTIIRSAVS
jgi:acetylornithine deacetylase